MPKKTKELELANDEKQEAKTTKKATKKVATKAPKAKTTAKSSKEKATTTRKTATKKVASKTASTKKPTTKTTTAKKSTTKATAKSTITTKAKTRTKKVKSEPINILEYYDLPYRYNQTIVKILAQTPKMLFVYWDISDTDRKKYEEHYGSNFFAHSHPVLIIHNQTMNYSFELEINDFANSWYIQVNDANCKYNVELGRRPNQYLSELKEPYVYISSSNPMDFPNDHILFEKAKPDVKFKNVKTNETFTKTFAQSLFVKNFMKMYQINTLEELYQKLYSSELLEEFKNKYHNNPSSNSFK